ncbi:MAG TPA: DUF2934 domain-containing protein [Candidatus Methylomirabilis sp.]|nr:DUF2934 domain-containing protein [Candidatus Methylomirabilis sp.]
MNPIRRASTASTVGIISVNSVEQARRIDQAIARRAYEIFERRGGMGWHELEDWRDAESEVRSKLCVGLTSSDDSLLVSCNVARFEDHSVGIWVAPKQMTICGKLIGRNERRDKQDLQPYQGVAFRVVALPVEIDPCRVVANLRHTFLEIRLPMIHPKYEERNRALAA